MISAARPQARPRDLGRGRATRRSLVVAARVLVDRVPGDGEHDGRFDGAAIDEISAGSGFHDEDYSGTIEDEHGDDDNGHDEGVRPS